MSTVEDSPTQEAPPLLSARCLLIYRTHTKRNHAKARHIALSKRADRANVIMDCMDGEVHK